MKLHKEIAVVKNWFHLMGFKPFPFQLNVWKEYLSGKSGLIHASTGTGKTYAAFFGAVIEYLSEKKSGHKNSRKTSEDLTVLWITPLRALASDTLEALQRPVDDLDLNWSVEKRTGDTSSAQRQRQKNKLPTVLITTPESLSLLISYPNSRELFQNLKLIVADEWHELMGSKRGVLAELAVARLKYLRKDLRIWGLSATLGNTETAMEVLLGTDHKKGILIQGHIPKETLLKTIIPETVDRFPWAGHLGITLLPKVISYIEESESCIVFTNTRSQTEIWFQAILDAKPDWAGLIALHHGSMDKDQRRIIEDFLREGKLKCVVATSSLDLGVDFAPVDRVFQIGSPKGIARLLQRAGRSGHNPGRKSDLICVPTNSFELIEFGAVRSAIKKKFIEPRFPITHALDVLAQHIVTIALSEGFNPDELFIEVRSTNALKDLTEREWEWVLDFAAKGGPALRAYPEFKRMEKKDGKYYVENKSIARRHRMSIGTITSDSSLLIKFLKGGRLGSIEESFISKLKPGDTFIFSGRVLEYVRIKDMTVWVRKAKKTKGPIPQWMGGRMPLSTELASEVREKFHEAKLGIFKTEELEAVKPLLEIQQRWSVIPDNDELLIERIKTREGFHIFIYPFEGRLVHEGLAALFAYRFSKIKSMTFSISTNDYGFEMLSDSEIPIEDAIDKNLVSEENLLVDILQSLNSSEMARRQFREIARVAGLVFQGYPGANKSVKQIQASSGLFYDVFTKYDPDNLLLKQAAKEVHDRQLEESRLKKTLERLSVSKILIKNIKHFTPLAFPIMAARFREKISSEKLSDRIKRMQVQLERAAEN